MIFRLEYTSLAFYLLLFIIIIILCLLLLSCVGVIHSFTHGCKFIDFVLDFIDFACVVSVCVRCIIMYFGRGTDQVNSCIL